MKKILNRLDNNAGLALLLALTLGITPILINATPEFIQEPTKANKLFLFCAYSGLVLAYIVIYKGLRGDEARQVKNFKTVKR